MKLISHFISSLIIRLIKLYQKTLSFDHGVFSCFYPEGFCRYHPSCSEYAIRAIKKYGLIKGLGRGLWRIVRCNPLSRGGVDQP